MVKIMKLIGMSVFGFIVCASGGCVVSETPGEEGIGEDVSSAELTGIDDVTAGTQLVLAGEAAELREVGASIMPVRGETPELIPGSMRVHSEHDALLEDPGGDARGLDGSALPSSQALALTPNLFDDGEFSYKSGLWGTSYDVVVSKQCVGRTRDFSDAYVYNDNGGYCSVVGWYTQDPSDCRFIIHVGASANKHGICAWSVYANEIGYFSYTASNTNSAQQNTTNAAIYLTAGQKLTAGTCGLPNASASGDTYLRLFDGGALVAHNDDACGGLSSSLVYTAPSEKKYELRAGCYGSGSCGGTVVWAKQP